jgi:predicted double-glycine peptidase
MGGMSAGTHAPVAKNSLRIWVGRSDSLFSTHEDAAPAVREKDDPMSLAKIAASARRAGLATVLAAAATATVVGFAGAAHAATSDSNHPGGMYGNPAAAAPYWREQTNDSDCGEMAVADVVGQVTGNEPTEKQITAVAENTPSTVHSGPIWTPGKYTSNGDLAALLAHYGIQSAASHGSMQGLEQDLANGQKPIVGLNAETIWNQPGDRTNEDHFVVVTGIDTSTGMVHLNDSGIKNGQDEQVPISTFEKAWATSHNFVVVTS